MQVSSAPKNVTAIALSSRTRGDGRRVAVRSALPGADRIAILIDHNPNPLAAMFSLAPGTVAAVETRVKMAQHSALTVLVRVDGRFHMASRVVQVTVGGCG